jgi:anti-anti-sigma factor
MRPPPDPAPVIAARFRPHRIVAELDAHGAIDGHAAMCLNYAIAGALAGGARSIVIDQRDLTTIDAAALALFAKGRADCHAHGVELELLVSDRAAHRALAHQRHRAV